MIVFCVQCEMCSNHFNIPAHSRPYEWEVPSGWLTVIEGNPQHNEGQHFCSKDCLRAWVVGEEGAKA